LLEYKKGSQSTNIEPAIKGLPGLPDRLLLLSLVQAAKELQQPVRWINT